MLNEKLDAFYASSFGERYGRTMPFALGGAIDEAGYVGSCPRVVFILKEVNSFDVYSVRGYPGWIANQAESGKPFKWYTWGNIGLWSYGLQNAFPSFPPAGQQRRQAVAEGLKAAALINLHKGFAGSTSSWASIALAAQEDVGVWSEELRVLAPSIAVCCNTFEPVVDSLGIKKERVTTREGVTYWSARWSLGANDLLLIDFWHPQGTKWSGDGYYQRLSQLVMRTIEVMG